MKTHWIYALIQSQGITSKVVVKVLKIHVLRVKRSMMYSIC